MRICEMLWDPTWDFRKSARGVAPWLTLPDRLTLLFRSSIQPFGHENKNHQVGESGHAETISICDPDYATIRSILVENGKKTATWLMDQFLHSPDVHVANTDHFIETLRSWGTDPCDSSM